MELITDFRLLGLPKIAVRRGTNDLLNHIIFFVDKDEKLVFQLDVSRGDRLPLHLYGRVKAAIVSPAVYKKLILSADMGKKDNHGRVLNTGIIIKK